MNLRPALGLAALAFCLVLAAPAGAEDLNSLSKNRRSVHLLPGERMVAGQERGGPLLKSAAEDVVRAPATVPWTMHDEVRQFGPLGLISGAVRGGVKGAVLAMRGGGRAIIGSLDLLTAPVGGLD